MENHTVLFDNSSLAGVMRRLFPRLHPHQGFLSNYPAHQEVDTRSFKEFLTAICLFDKIVIDSVSELPGKEFANIQLQPPGSLL